MSVLLKYVWYEAKSAAFGMRGTSNGFDVLTSVGRKHKDRKEDWGFDWNDYKCDRKRIVLSKQYRALQKKTQVFVQPGNSGIRTRASHTVEVEQYAIELAYGLGYNYELCAAGSTLHDTGHVLFGHLGEKVISGILGEKFRHDVFAVIAAQEIERKGRGLNLSYETLLCALQHSGSWVGKSLEGQLAEARIVQICDKLAFVFSDYNDIIRYGFEPVPEVEKLMNEFGSDQRERVLTCMAGIALETKEAKQLSFEHDPIAKTFLKLLELMYEKVYSQFNAMREAQASVIHDVYRLLCRCGEFDEHTALVALCLLTDDDAELLGQMARNRPSIKPEELRGTSLFDVYPSLIGRKISLTLPDLSWAEVPQHERSVA